MSQLDNEAIRIIAQRNGMNGPGLGAAAKKLSPEDQQLLARMQTDRQGRAVLGAVAKQLQQLYALTANTSLPWGAGSYREATKRSLDQTNNYAQKAYASIPDDDAPLSPLARKRIEEVVRETRRAMAEIPADVDDLNRGLTGMIVDALTSRLPKWLQPQDPNAKKNLDKVFLALGITAAVIGVIVAVRLVTKVALGESELAAAEDEAVRIADAIRRKRHSRSAFSLS